MKLTPSQEVAYEALKRGENVFLTGGAGTGKTALINKFVEDIDPTCEHTILAATTGKAALNFKIGDICGQTVHKIFGLKNDIAPKYKSKRFDLVERADRIIIDEISMLRIDIFDYIAEALQDIVARKEAYDEQFQIILVGDFYQLAPVLSTDNKAGGDSDKTILDGVYECDIGKGYCFQSYSWDYLGIKMYQLTEIVRQSDEKFCDSLAKIRQGDPKGITYINAKVGSFGLPTEKQITLCGKNERCEAINKQNFDKLKSAGATVYCSTLRIEIEKGLITEESARKIAKKSLPCEEALKLCVGARVMCIANNPAAMNGEIGEVVSVRNGAVTVCWETGGEKRLSDVERYSWAIGRQELVLNELPGGFKDYKIKYIKLATVTQYPLKLAYAMTVHKAQGQTLEKCTILVDDFFTEGHLYTALSRCKTVEGIRLDRKLRKKDVKCDDSINDFYKENGGLTE